MTEAERLLWRELRSRQLAGHKFRRQQQLGRFIVDFLCLEKRLVIELDGGQHADPIYAAQDAARTAWVEESGFRILRFWNHDVLKNLDAIKETIAHALA